MAVPLSDRQGAAVPVLDCGEPLVDREDLVLLGDDAFAAVQVVVHQHDVEPAELARLRAVETTVEEEEAKALAAAQQARFTPGKQRDLPVEVWVTLPYGFVLD